MANIKSQIKRNKQNEKARLRNKSVKSALKTAVRRVREAVAAGEADKATDLMQAANRQLDKAASKGVIHKNQAANRKSGLATLVNTTEAPATEATEKKTTKKTTTKKAPANKAAKAAAK